MNPPLTVQLLEKIAQIQRMERGKLTIMREGPQGPYYKLQARENGRNLSRYVARQEADSVQEALEGYRQFQALTQQYAQTIIDQTRADWAAHSKKKRYRLHRKSSWLRTKKCNN
jgi:hypothetical protein